MIAKFEFHFVFQVNFGRHCTNVTNKLVDMCQDLISSLSYHKNGGDYAAELVVMQNAHLPDPTSEHSNTSSWLCHCLCVHVVNV